MPVDSPHKEYSEYCNIWERCRDAAAGEDAIKKGGEKYLPRPAGQNDAEYKAYLARAYWFNATQRTVDGLTGLVYRKEPKIEAPDSMADMLDDITMSGVTFRELSAQVVEDVIKIGRCGILVDFPRVNGRVETVYQAEQAGARPYMVMYDAEHITNWRYGRVGTSTTALTLVVLKECDYRDGDEFAPKEIEQRLVLDLAEGRYRQRRFEKRVANQTAVPEWIMVDEVYPIMGGSPLSYIPFYFHGVSRSDGKMEMPPIYDLVNVNVSHYHTLADLEHARHWSALPTPVFSGVSRKSLEENGGVALGGTSGIVLEPQGSTASYLEVQGDFAALRMGAQDKENQMALLGARIIAPEKTIAETAQTAAIHRAGENSVLASIAVTNSRIFTEELQLVGEWGGIQGWEEIEVELNTVFLAETMDPSQLIALVNAVQSGKMPMTDFFDALQKGGIVSSDRTFEQFMADLMMMSPGGMGGSATRPPAEEMPPENGEMNGGQGEGRGG